MQVGGIGKDEEEEKQLYLTSSYCALAEQDYNYKQT